MKDYVVLGLQGLGYCILVLVAAIFIASVSGCATSQQYSTVGWKPQRPQLAQDLSECRLHGASSSPNNPLIAGELAKQCMEVKGYRR